MPANDKSTQDYFGHAIILSDTHIDIPANKIIFTVSTSAGFVPSTINSMFPTETHQQI